MPNLKKFARENPELAALLKRFAMAVLLGSDGSERNALLSEFAALDSDGDGIPDAIDPDTKPAPKKRGPKAPAV